MALNYCNTICDTIWLGFVCLGCQLGIAGGGGLQTNLLVLFLLNSLGLICRSLHPSFSDGNSCIFKQIQTLSLGDFFYFGWWNVLDSIYTAYFCSFSMVIQGTHDHCYMLIFFLHSGKLSVKLGYHTW